jgi:hypothetical protein
MVAEIGVANQKGLKKGKPLEEKSAQEGYRRRSRVNLGATWQKMEGED